MKKTPLVAALLVGLLALVSRDAGAQSEPALSFGPCRALSVSEGDSADLQCGSDFLRVRMRNVAAPRPGQVGHGEAVRALAELLRERELFVAADAAGELPRDGDGRALVYLYDRSGANLNVVLVLLGWATYTTADAGASRFEKGFRAAEHDARADQRALWTVWSVSADR